LFFLDKYLIELDIKNILFKMKDAKLSSLTNNLILDYHRKTHMLYTVATKKNPPNKTFANSMVSLHDKFVKEMIRRKMKHNTPLNKI